jgi:hypothetical protein
LFGLAGNRTQDLFFSRTLPLSHNSFPEPNLMQLFYVQHFRSQTEQLNSMSGQLTLLQTAVGEGLVRNHMNTFSYFNNNYTITNLDSVIDIAS